QSTSSSDRPAEAVAFRVPGRALPQGAPVDTRYVTAGGVGITRTAEPFSPADLDAVCALVDRRRGGVLSSRMEYPGRYIRWPLASANPCVEIAARGRRVTVRALNARGEVLLPALAAAVRRAGDPSGPEGPREAGVVIPEPAGLVAEEERSRR